MGSDSNLVIATVVAICAEANSEIENVVPQVSDISAHETELA